MRALRVLLGGRTAGRTVIRSTHEDDVLGGLLWQSVRPVNAQLGRFWQGILQIWIRPGKLWLSKGANRCGVNEGKEAADLLNGVEVRENIRVVHRSLNSVQPVENLPLDDLEGVFVDIVGLKLAQALLTQSRSLGCAALPQLAIEQLQQLIQLDTGVEIFREKVSRIHFAVDLAQLKITQP